MPGSVSNGSLRGEWRTITGEKPQGVASLPQGDGMVDAQLQGFVLHFLVTRSGRIGSGGESLHGLFLNLVRRSDPALAARLHDGAVKSFSLGQLRGAQPDLTAPTGLHCRVGALEPALLRTIPLFSDGLEECSLGSARVRLLGVERDEERPQTAFTALLAAPFRKASFNFLSPVSFRHQGVQDPFPTPTLVFASLRRRWEALTSVPLPAPEEMEDLVRTERYTLHTSVTNFSRFLIVGAVGRVSYALPRTASRAAAATFSALCRLAPYTGVGHQTAKGLGEVRVTPGDFLTEEGDAR